MNRAAWGKALLGSFIAGAVAWLLVGGGPRSVDFDDSDTGPWRLPAAPEASLVAAGDVWQARQPWGQGIASAPLPLPDNGEAVVAPPVLAQGPGGAALIGVVVGPEGARALFVMAGRPPMRLALGDEFPGGGRLTEVSSTHVAWQDADGDAHRHQLLSTPRGAASGPNSP